MPTRMRPPRRSEVCANCGQPAAAHLAANYADGAFVSGVLLVCPRATWKPDRPPTRRPRTRAHP